MTNEISARAALIAAVAALISALVAVAALWIQERRSRRLLAIELLFKFDDRFNSEAFQRMRTSAAKALQERREDPAAVDDVLDFFETMGLLARRGVLDMEMLWSTFFTWLDGYWHAAREYFKDVTADDTTTWTELEYLHSALRAIDKNKADLTDSELIWSREDIEDFIESEASLLNLADSKSAARTPRSEASRKQKGARGFKEPEPS